MADIVSERYALSLYEIAQSEGKTRAYLDEFTAVSAIFREQPDFLKVLTTPSIALENKQNALRAAFEGRVEPFLLNFLMLITEKGRAGLLHDMCQAYKAHYNFENGIVEVVAVTAAPLSEALQDKLRAKMEAVTGKTVALMPRIDKDLIGGIVVKVDNKQFDTSLRTKLSELAVQLTNTIA